MPFTAQRPNPQRAPTAVMASTPAPYGGWNARDARDVMPESDAVDLENLYPDTEGVRLRNGRVSHATGLGAAGKTLMAYHGPSGTNKLFAADATVIYDVTSAGAASSAVTGMSNAKWQYVNYNDAANHWLIACNGADTPRTYDGTTWSTIGFTGSGLTVTDLIHCCVFQRRVFYVEKDNTRIWYSGAPASPASGTVTEFDFGPLLSKGGYIMACAAWTRDAGDGMDDNFVVISSEGQAIVYQGADPASSWTLVGVYDIGRPLGRRCWTKFGGDLVLITEDGYVTLSQALASATVDERVYLSDKIQGAVRKRVESHRADFGWQPVLHTGGNKLLFNVPTVASTDNRSELHVMNLATRAWCKFTGWNVNCLEVFNGDLYGIEGTVVYKIDTTDDDAGSAITGKATCAWRRFAGGRIVHHQQVRPQVRSGAQIDLAVRVNTNYKDDAPSYSPTYSVATTLWGSPWGSPWSQSTVARGRWVGSPGLGHVSSLKLEVQLKDAEFIWYGTDWMYTVGGYQ